MAFKLGAKETPGKSGTSTTSAGESTAAGRVNLMAAAKNVPDKKVQKNYTPSFQPMQPKVHVDTHGGGDIGISGGKKFSFGAGVNINPKVEGLRANIGYKDKASLDVEKTKFGTNVSAGASIGKVNINATQESGELGYKSVGMNFNKGSLSGGVDYTLDNQGDRAMSAGASFRKKGAGVFANANAYNEKVSGSMGGSFRMGKATVNASAKMSPGNRTSFGGGITYRF